MVFEYAKEASDLFSGGHILLSFSSNGEGFMDKFILFPCQIYPLVFSKNAKKALQYEGW